MRPDRRPRLCGNRVTRSSTNKGMNVKLPKPTLSLAALMAANLVPLGGVTVLGWDAKVIVLLYWSENVVLGFYTILKIAAAKVEHPLLHATKLFLIPFFCVHFGGFCLVHGIFILAFFGPGAGMKGVSLDQLWQSLPYGIQWPFVCLFLSHGVSFVQNFVLKKEYASLPLAKVMVQPYGRIVVLHIAIVAGAFPIMALGSPAPLLFILVLLKTVIDIRLHVRSHRLAAARAAERDKAGQGEPAMQRPGA